MALRSSEAPSVMDFELAALSALLAGSIAPLVVLAIAASAFGNEVEDRTLANLTLAPLPRWRIVVPKLLAVIAVADPFIAVSAFVTGQVAFLGGLKATHHAITLMHGLDERRFAAMGHLSLGAAIVTSLVVFGGFLLLSIRRLRRMDVP